MKRALAFMPENRECYEQELERASKRAIALGVSREEMLVIATRSYWDSLFDHIKAKGTKEEKANIRGMRTIYRKIMKPLVSKGYSLEQMQEHFEKVLEQETENNDSQAKKSWQSLSRIVVANIYFERKRPANRIYQN